MSDVTLGTQGLRVPAVGLGCMGMSDFYGPSSEAQNLRVLERAAALGCTFWDTSDMYGPFTNEELLSKALAGRREKIILATKFGVARSADGAWLGIKGSADYVRRSCEASLARLKTDHLDLYYQHRVDPEVPMEDVAGTVKELIEAGKVLHFGLSEAAAGTIRRAHAVQPVAAVQSEYSMWWRDREQDTIPVLDELGIGLVPFSPLGKGFLTGTIDATTTFAPTDFRGQTPRFQGEALAANLALVEVLNRLADATGATPAQLALTWLLHQRPWIVPIPGTKRVERLEENLGAASVELTDAQLAELRAAADQIHIVGARYPEAQDALTNRDAPAPGASSPVGSV